mgnify:CR=1 FL=1
MRQLHYTCDFTVLHDRIANLKHGYELHRFLKTLFRVVEESFKKQSKISRSEVACLMQREQLHGAWVPHESSLDQGRVHAKTARMRDNEFRSRQENGTHQSICEEIFSFYLRFISNWI